MRRGDCLWQKGAKHQNIFGKNREFLWTIIVRCSNCRVLSISMGNQISNEHAGRQSSDDLSSSETSSLLNTRRTRECGTAHFGHHIPKYEILQKKSWTIPLREALVKKKNVFFSGIARKGGGRETPARIFGPFFHHVFTYILTSISCYLILFGHF